MVFALKRLSLLLNKKFQILLIVEDLLDVFLHRADEKFILFIPLLHASVFFFKRSNTLFHLG